MVFGFDILFFLNIKVIICEEDFDVGLYFFDMFIGVVMLIFDEFEFLVFDELC